MHLKPFFTLRDDVTADHRVDFQSCGDGYVLAAHADRQAHFSASVKDGFGLIEGQRSSPGSDLVHRNSIMFQNMQLDFSSSPP
jgi:ribosomal protein S27AE